MIIIGVLASLSVAAAAGIRIALPLLIIGLIREQLWDDLPVLSRIHPQVVLAILISWSLFELFGSKSLLGQRALQIVQLIFSPVVGSLLSITVVKMFDLHIQPLWILGLVGGLLAFVIGLVQTGWFFRLRGIPPWVAGIEDILCLFLVVFALKAPKNGGLIALLLLWIALRSSNEWRRWYSEQKR